MVVFLDTSALYALADQDDLHHQESRLLFSRLLGGDVALLTHSYVLIETAALLQRRLGWDVARRFLVESAQFSVRWVDQGLHARAVERWQAAQGRISLVDAASFVVMEEAGASDVLAFDEDFQKAGFRPYRG